MNCLLLTFLAIVQLSRLDTAAQPFVYPATPKVPVADTIFRKVIIDNYRWMEDVTNPQMQTWVRKQSELTNDWLNKILGRNHLIEEYHKLDKLESEQISLFIRRESNHYFYQKTLPGENVGKLYYRKGKVGAEVLLFDPVKYTADSEQNISYEYLPSKDGKKVALRISENGNYDIGTVRILNVDTRKLYDDSLYPVNSVEAWTPDSKGFFYSALNTSDHLSTALFQDVKIKYHLLGSVPAYDKTILSRLDNPELQIHFADLPGIKYSPDYKYLHATLWRGQGEYRSFFAPVADGQTKNFKWMPLAKTEDQVLDVILYKEHAYILSRKDAPNFKILVTPLNNVDVSHAKTIIPESTRSIGWITVTKDFLLVQKQEGMNFFYEKFNFSTSKITSVKLPVSGAPWIYSLDPKTNDCIMNVLSWNQPSIRYDFDAVTEKVTPGVFNTAVNYPGVKDLIVEEVEVKSHDGVMVPLSIMYNKNLKKNGKNIVWMMGYGSYGVHYIHYFDKMYLPLLNRRVVLAKAHTRGGGIKGYKWHMGGFKATKPNTWKDFIACGEYLIQKGFTSPERLTGEGTSAGGILIGRAITERPDLFAASIHNVPLSNPLRGENRPNGILDSKEFGTAKDSAEAMGLIEMDAYLKVRRGTAYGGVLAVAGVNDTRVPVWQPAKLIAALQDANTSQKPMFLLVNYDSGHGSDEKKVLYRNLANQFAFALWQAGHKDFQPNPNTKF